MVKIFKKWRKFMWKCCYLILDKALLHLTKNVLEMFKNNKQFKSYIPGGLTRFIQSLDIVINKPFKEALRKKYIELLCRSFIFYY